MGEEKREKFRHEHSLEKHKEIGVHINIYCAYLPACVQPDTDRNIAEGLARSIIVYCLDCR
jgi:hypothetical protein